MRIVTTTSVFPPCWDSKNMLRRLRDCGFYDLDLAFDFCVQDPAYPFMTDRYEDWAKALAEDAASLGMRFTHSHAPFDADERCDLIEKTLRCASILGIGSTVVHPVAMDRERVPYVGEEFLSVNVNAITPLLELAQKHNVVLLSENLLWGDSIKATAISSLVKEVNSPYFGWCYDTGHAHSRKDPIESLLACEVAPLSLHLQDNFGAHDPHLIPGDGNLDFDRVFACLKEIGYRGELVLEAHHQALDAPDDQRDDVLRRLYQRALWLQSRYAAE